MIQQPQYHAEEKYVQLLERARLGEAKAQQQLYNRYLKAMRRIAERITGDTMEAEDVLQEAFLRAFSKLGAFKGDATFGAWLKRIVINTAINHVKRKRMEWLPLDPERIDANQEVLNTSPSSLAMREIYEAIDRLPEGYQAVFKLYLFEGYDHQEIGFILNISEATSKSQFSRAKKKLREILSPRMASYAAVA